MISNDQQKIIDKVEDLILAAEKRFSDAYPEVFKTLYEDTLKVIAGVQFYGSADQRAKEMIQLARLKDRLEKLVYQNKEYKAAVKELTGTFQELKDLSDDYFRLIIDGYSPRSDLYQAILKANVELTKDALLGAGVAEAYSIPITRAIQASLTKRSGRPELEKVLDEVIRGNKDVKPLLRAQLETNSRDAINIFNRQYLDTVSADLNISYYIYSGTRIATTRSFCAARHGKIYPKKEIQKWASLDWQGKMPGTNAQTIFSFVGGYNCRHQLWPATKAQWQAQEAAKKK